MRLICPNCGAQYEVADDVIPAAGRDVQCSNCGHTWFESPGASEAAEADIDLPAAADPAVEPPAFEDDPRPEPGTFVWEDDDAAEDDERIVAGAAADEPRDADADTPDAVTADTQDAAETEDDDDTGTFDAIAGATRQRREIPSDVADILREEAAREDEQRRANIRATLESQPELGFDNATDPDAQRHEEARRRMARMRGEAAPPIGADTSASRRDLLPDIEEINSTLRATTQRAEMADAPPPPEAERRRGFRFGFSTMVVIALIAAGLYIAAPKIIKAVPATEAVLTVYVNGVDQVRLWLDLKMQQILAQMNPPAGTPSN